jgi:hypothetical protein
MDRYTNKEKRTVNRGQTWRVILAALMLALPLLTACDSGGSSTTSDPVSREQYGGEYQGGVATGDTEAGAAFARWVLEQDPERKLITDVVVRGEQDLGIKVRPNTMTNADVQKLLMSVTLGMARTFRDKPLKVIAFYQSGDKIAEASYNHETGKIDVQFER